MVAFGGVVVDHVQNHLDAGIMQGVDHLTELAPLRAVVGVCRICVVGREEIQRHVTPVVAFVRVELKHGHQLHRSDAEFGQVRDLFDEARERPAFTVADFGTGVLGQPANMRLVDHKIRPMPQSAAARSCVFAKARVEQAKGGLAEVGSGFSRRFAIEVAREKDTSRTGVEQQFFGIERVPLVSALRCRAIDLPAEELRLRTGRPGHPTMPHGTGFVAERVQVSRERGAGGVVAEQQQPHIGCMPRIQGEIPGLLMDNPADSQRMGRAFH